MFGFKSIVQISINLDRSNPEPRMCEPLQKIKGMDYETPFVFSLHFSGNNTIR